MLYSFTLGIRAKTAKWLCVMLLCQMITCSQNEQTITLVDKAMSFAWSPDSKKLIYVKEVPTFYDTIINHQYYDEEVYIKDLYSNMPDQIYIPRNGDIFSLDWSNDGTKIAVEKRNDDYRHI